MKTLKTIFHLFIAIVLSLSSCSDFLDLKPISDISVDDFYKTQSQIELATIGLYGTLQDVYVSDYIDFAELPSDNIFTVNSGTSDGGQFDKFSFSTMNGSIETMWMDTYSSIFQANEVLEKSSIAEYSSEEWRLSRESEAKFIRALNYFNLVRLWGDVPLIVTSTKLEDLFKVTRTSASDVYEQIVSDLDFATKHLPVTYDAADVGRATKGAAFALLGKVYLTQNNFEDAVSILDSVMSLNVYNLLPVFSDIFAPDNANHKESIFEIQYKGGQLGEGSRWGFRAHQRALATVFGISSADASRPTNSIKQAFNKNSARYAESIGSVKVKKNTIDHIKKHYMEHTVQNQSDDNWPLIRYADVLLMYAEASNEINGPTPEAIELINKIRRRAFGLPINGNDDSRDLKPGQYNSKERFREIIWNERRLELAFEGHRWFDLVRTDQYVQVMNDHFNDEFNGLHEVKPYHKLIPIPQREIDINPLLEQNPGY